MVAICAQALANAGSAWCARRKACVRWFNWFCHCPLRPSPRAARLRPATVSVGASARSYGARINCARRGHGKHRAVDGMRTIRMNAGQVTVMATLIFEGAPAQNIFGPFLGFDAANQAHANLAALCAAHCRERSSRCACWMGCDGQPCRAWTALSDSRTTCPTCYRSGELTAGIAVGLALVEPSPAPAIALAVD